MVELKKSVWREQTDRGDGKIVAVIGHRTIHLLITLLASAALLVQPGSARAYLACVEVSACPLDVVPEPVDVAAACCAAEKPVKVVEPEHCEVMQSVVDLATATSVPDCCIVRSTPPASAPPVTPALTLAPPVLVALPVLLVEELPVGERVGPLVEVPVLAPPWLLDAVHSCAARGPPPCR